MLLLVLGSFFFASPRSIVPFYFNHVPPSPLPTKLLWKVAHACPLPLFFIIAAAFLLYRLLAAIFAILSGTSAIRPSWTISTRLIHSFVQSMTEVIPPQARHTYLLCRIFTTIPIPSFLVRARVETVNISMLDSSLWDKVWLFVAGTSCPVKYSNTEFIKGEWVMHYDVKPKSMEESHIVLYLHGGAHMMGSPGSHRGLISALSKSIKCPILAIDYTVSPEALFPTAIYQSLKAYQSLIQGPTATTKSIIPTSHVFFTNPSSSYTFKHSQITIIGDSSGGCLALQTLLLLPHTNLPPPSSVVFLSPHTDISMSQAIISPNLASDILAFDSVGYTYGKHLYTDFPITHPLVSPCFTTDFSALSGVKVLIQVGDAEILLGDSVRLFEGVKQRGGAGCEVEMQIWKDCFHVWQAFPGVAAKEAILKVGEFVRRERALDEGDSSGNMFSRFVHKNVKGWEQCVGEEGRRRRRLERAWSI
ncbi:alpha/beta-hydrolase [Rhizoclosmatium globosum]|uniref:Alpha/beta-hydrolase n=1 Tax=Rhizoclosmatium globosum TaxID=329046 RepID=A0A1Y2CSN4_9FUNG|nr:alpha/beta-hydrolase [Rhizoclosmatium globosum]|eukprot:ORY50080.1 alpha/beta-hydrolase [Rhizoclosmatium globosum]